MSDARRFSDDMLLVLETKNTGAVSRRDWMLHVLESGVAMGVMPALAGAQEHAHGNDAATNGETESRPWAPQALSGAQNETLVALGERIIPGSAEAQCNRLIDSVLPMESGKNRSKLLETLAAFDGEAERLYKRPFRQLDAAQQDEMLLAASQESGKLHVEFGIVKEWMADAYWSSLKGLHELGWTGRVAWDSFPGCGSGRPHN